LYIAKLNNTVTRAIKVSPNKAMDLEYVEASSIKKDNPSPKGVSEEVLELNGYQKVRYLYQPGELEGGQRRATDPNWSLTMHDISRVSKYDNQPYLYYLEDGPKRSFTREELMVVPEDSQLPPDSIL
jgi:hypothetical protein